MITVLRRQLIGAAAVLAVVLGAPAGADPAGPSAQQVVAQFDAQLLATMKQADQLGFAGRYKKLAPQVDGAFDLAFIAKLALGDQWDTLAPGQQKAYVAKFRKETIATYADRFDGYDGQRFEIVDVRDATGDRRQIDTMLVGSDGKRTPISYVLQQRHDRWRIVNVVARGVSNLALKRGQYTSVIRDQGPKAFLDKLDAQLAKYPSLPER